LGDIIHLILVVVGKVGTQLDPKQICRNIEYHSNKNYENLSMKLIGRKMMATNYLHVSILD
jgi:hypothetical protein